MVTKRPDKFLFNDDTFYVPVRKGGDNAKCIDGMIISQRLHSRRSDLTPVQLKWCRQYEREEREPILLRKIHKKLIEEKNMSIQDAKMMIKKLMDQ